MSWDSNLAAVDLAVAAYFDTVPFRLVPYVKIDVNGKAQPDPDREAFDFNGSIEIEPKRFDIAAGANSRSEGGRRHVGGEIVLTALTTGWPYQPRTGDGVEQLPGETGLPVRPFLVSEIHRDGTARILLILNKA